MTTEVHTLPKKGMSPKDVQGRIDGFRKMDPSFERGRMTAYCMMGSRDVQEVVEKAYYTYFFQNGIVRRFMPGLLQMEAELRSMCAGVLSGGTPGVRVNFTTGGSESLFCGMHALREWARERYPRITRPQVIAPFSAHATISKACHYLDIELTRIAVGKDYRADVAAMKAAIGPNTVGLIGSAPSWPYGKIDPIADLAAVARERDLWVHVDACVGGYLAPFVSRAGYPVPAWDFSVDGVTSISADLHKYGYAPKPASTIAFRSEDLLKYHNVFPDEWPSMRYMAEGMVGSRPAGAIAAAWAVMHYLGEEGYVDFARRTMKAKARLEEGIRALDLTPWQTDLCVLLFETGDLKAEEVVGGMNEAGWPCMGTQRPPLVQLIIDPFAEEVADDYLRDLGEVVSRLRAGKQVKKGALGYAD
jgi:sphinganine-1-phosphate aldolase